MQSVKPQLVLVNLYCPNASLRLLSDLSIMCMKVSCSDFCIFQGSAKHIFIQEQARGYGHITHKRGRTSGGHYFQDLFTAKPLDAHHFLRYEMIDLDIVFPRIPHNPL